MSFKESLIQKPFQYMILSLVICLIQIRSIFSSGLLMFISLHQLLLIIIVHHLIYMDTLSKTVVWKVVNNADVVRNILGNSELR